MLVYSTVLKYRNNRKKCCNSTRQLLHVYMYDTVLKYRNSGRQKAIYKILGLKWSWFYTVNKLKSRQVTIQKYLSKYFAEKYMSLSRTKFTEWLKKNQNSKETSVQLNLRSRFVPTSFYRLWKGNKTSELNIDTRKICQCSKSFHGVLKHSPLICYSYELNVVLIFKPCGFDKVYICWSKMPLLCIAIRN